MLLGCASEVLRRAQHEESYEFVLCENPLTEAQGPLFFWSYVPTVPRRPEARVVPSCCLELLLSGSPFHLSTGAAVEWMYRAFPWLGEAGMACCEALRDICWLTAVLSRTATACAFLTHLLLLAAMCTTSANSMSCWTRSSPFCAAPRFLTPSFTFSITSWCSSCPTSGSASGRVRGPLVQCPARRPSYQPTPSIQPGPT